ncbi:MAG: transposase [Coriobacteriia bacterium]|nr:transposase [Coriobacteriia bacterium]
MTPDTAEAGFDLWLERAASCGIDVFEGLGRKVGRRKASILAAVSSGVSNARVEAMNNKIKLIVRRGYGFRNTDNLMALVMLCCSSLPLALPGR